MVIKDRVKKPGHGKTFIKNKTIRKLPINFDIESLNLMCTYVLTNNRSIKRGAYINMRNLIELLDLDRYIHDQERYKRILFIKKGIEARLERQLTDPVAIIKYINGGFMESDIVDINNFIEMSTGEIEWINETVSNTLSCSFLYERAEEGIDILTRLLAAEASNINSVFIEAKEYFRDINNRFRKNDSVNSTEKTFNLGEESFKSVLADVYDTLNSKFRYLVTGMQGFNQLIGGGFENTRCYLLFGLTGVGKSLSMLNIAYQMKKYNKGFKPKDPTKRPCIVFLTMENDVTETIQRLFTIATGEDIRNHTLEEVEMLLRTQGELYLSDDSPIDLIIKYKPNRSVDTGYLYTLVEDLEDEGYETICLFQDHVKRIRSVAGNTDLRLELGDVVNEMKTFAILKDIPVITDSHLNREGAKIIDEKSTRATMDLTRMLGKSNVGESLLMLDNVDLGIILNKEFDAEGNEYMAFKNIKQRVRTYRDYICQPFHKDNSIKLIEDFYSPVPVFKESLYTVESTLNTSYHNDKVKTNGYSTNIKSIDDGEDNIFEFSTVYSSEDVKKMQEQLTIPETNQSSNLIDYTNPYMQQNIQMPLQPMQIMYNPQLDEVELIRGMIYE